MIRIATVATADPADQLAAPPAERQGPFAVIPFQLLERAIEALRGDAHFAGDIRMLGLDDAEMINPLLTAGHFRFAREVRRELLEELLHNA